MPEEQSYDIRQIILEEGAREACRIDPRRVETGEWVRLKCQYGCGGYGRCLTCPPHSPTPERTRRLLDSYSVAYLIHWGERSGGRRALGEIERRAFLSGRYRALALASGPCELCQECPTEGHCRHPALARPSMEACGIDVYAAAQAAGMPLEVVRTREETPNFYSLLLVE